ncbi:Uncharacterized protein GBIM_00172 [Gryllus bimaculatus]|nr:Uncharacterized protein GBIM_00172 [Gryllus bimaculatus]
MAMDSSNSQTLEVVIKLIEAAADKDDGVREAVCSSLRKLAKKYPNDVLQYAMSYRKKHPKISNTHLLALLTLMEQICQEHLHSITVEGVRQLVSFTIEEMTRNPEYLPDTQLRASGMLVALGHKHCIEVMDGLVLKLQPGVLPHWAVLHTLADLAAANPYGLVPFVKATLGTLLPMLGAARSDAMRQAFAFALGRLSEAVLEYLAGLSSAPDPTVRADAFAAEVGAAYDVLATAWLGSRDLRVLSPVLAALGPMLALQGANRIREQAPRLIPTLLALYKRGCEPLPVTQCLAAVLQCVFENAPEAIETLLDVLVPALFDQICPLPDYAQPQTVKNHFEALRCFDHVARSHPNRLAEAILQLLRNNNERERARAMLVTAHLVGSSERLLGANTVDLVAGLHALPPETGNKAKKALLKAVVALAYRGHLVGAAGVHFIHFLVYSCCQQSDKAGNDDGEEFARTCASTLFLLASTVPAVEQILWPLLLHCLLQPKYTVAAGDLARCLAHLATHRAESGPNKLPIQTSKAASGGENLSDAELPPSPEAVLTRCLALLGAPLERNRGQSLLAFLQRYAASVNRLLPPLWEQRIPELLHHLEALGSDDDSQHRDHVWEDLLLEFVAATLTEIDQSAWALSLGSTLLAQYNNTPTQLTAERAALSKCLALAASHASDAGLLKRSLDALLGGARLHTAEESEAIGRAVGLLSRRHLAPVLARLDVLQKEEATLRRSSGRLLGIGWRGGGGGEANADRACLTLASCYGQVAMEAPATDLLPALEAGPDGPLKQVVLQALGCVAEGLHPNRSSSPLGLSKRADVLAQVLSQLKSQNIAVMTVTLQVTTSFLKLPPALNTEDRIAVLRVSFEEVFGSLFLTTKEQAVEREGGESLSDDHATSSLLSALGALTQALLLASTTPAVLDDVFSLLEPWLIVRSPSQRAAALSVLNGALQCYVSNMKFSCEAPSRFGQTGLMLGRVVPRCTDPSMEVRRLAVGTVPS